ncbi:MAG: tetratricopeptide repeat protein [Oligoflexales bacterium]|nr:tetratricopeptide repeat protein [Oligoflexales bacterium]
MNVLVISADQNNAKLVNDALKQLGFAKISVMENGLEALASVTKNPVGFAICDQTLKFISGWLFIKEIKLSDKVPNIPVILFGKDKAPDTEDTLKKYGILRYMQLPFSAADMNFAINSTLTLFNTSGTIENKFTQAKNSLIEDKVDKAIEIFSDLRSVTSGSLRSSMGLAQAYNQGNQKEKAEKIMDEIAQSTESGNPSSKLMSAKLALQKNDLRKANTYIDKLLMEIPNEFYYSRAIRLYLDFKKYREAESFCNAAFSRDFEIIDIYVCLAKCRYELGSYESSLKLIGNALEKFGKNSDLYNLRGVCYKKTGHFQEAIEAYEEALRLSPSDARVYFNLAQCSIGMKNYPTAQKYLESCLKLSPGFPRAREKLEELKKVV